MKRVALLLLSLCLLLTACAKPAEDERPVSLDLDRSFGQQYAACETEDAVYFMQWMGDHVILYADKAGGIGGPLCGKPECDHKGGGCNATLEGHPLMGIADYDGKLWFSNGFTIYRADYDGNNRETIREIDRELVYAMNFHNVWFHRGYAYFVGQTSTITNAVSQIGPFAYAVSLTDPEEEPIIIAKELISGRGVQANYDLVGDYLYIFLYTWDMDTDQGRSLYAARWHIETHETETLYDGAVDFIPNEYWALEDSILIAAGETVWELALQTGEIRLRMEFTDEEDGYLKFAANKVIHLCIPETWEDTRGRAHPLMYYIKDFDGNLIASGRIEPPDFDDIEAFSVGSSLVGVNDKAMYVQYDQHIIEEDGYKLNTRMLEVPLHGGEQRTIAAYDYSVRYAGR